MRHAGHRIRDERGNTLVETSLVIVIFITTLIGIFDVSQVLFRYHSISYRVEAAARYAVVNPFDAAAIQNMVLYNQPTRPSEGTPSFFGLSSSMVDVSRPDQETNDERIVITVSKYQLNLVTPGFAKTFTGPAITVVLPSETP